MNHNNPKAQQTFYDLEIARCNEKWVDIPELARRYKKYHPYESVLEFTARMEAEFILLVRQIRQEKYKSITSTSNKQNTSQVDLSTVNTPLPSNQSSGSVGRKWGNRQLVSNISSTSNLNTVGNTTVVKKNYPEESDFIHQLDDPNHVSISYRLLASQVQLILVRLLDVIQRQIKSGELETPDDWQAQFSKIILARIYFETERYDKTLEWLQHLALRLEDVETGYGLVLLVQARVMKGICYECQQNDNDALDSYLAALNVVEQHPQEQNKALSFWIEDCLYRSILLQLRRKGPVKQTLKLMRTYLDYCCTQWPTDWRIHKRWIVFRHYIRYLTRAYQKGVYVPATAQDEFVAGPMSPTRSVFSEAGESTLFERSIAALDETIQLMTQFRGLLAVFAPLLNKSNPVDLSHRTLELTNLLISAHDTVGWGPPAYIERTLKYLNRTRKFTFNSLCTTRHLFHTLVRVGDTAEARLALSYYLELLGVPDFTQLKKGMEEEEEVDFDDLVDTIQNRLEYISQLSAQSASKNIWTLENKLMKLQANEDSDDSSVEEYVDPSSPQKRKAPTGSCESDTEFDVVRLLLFATQQLYPQKGHEASVLSDIAVSLLEEAEILKRKKGSQWKLLMAQSKRQRGIAYGIYASQCQDAEKRSEYLTESLLSLKRATEMDTRSWQGFYQLALQQAIMGDMIQAASTIQRAIKLRGDFIPSWHLLALIQSSRQFHALPQSLQVIQAGLAYHLNMVENFDNEDIVENLSLETEEGLEFFDRAEAFLKLRITQTKLLEVLEGAEAVLKVYPDLFDMYAKLSKKMNLTVVVIEKVIEIPRKNSVHESSIKSRPRSRTNSSIRSSSSIFSENDSLDSTTLAQSNLEDDIPPPQVLRKVEEDDEEEEDFMPAEPKPRKSHSATSRLPLDDPLMSFPIKKKEKKEKKEKTKRSTFLSLKPSFRSNNSSDSKKDVQPTMISEDPKTSLGRQNTSKSMSSHHLQPPPPSQQTTYTSLLNKEEIPAVTTKGPNTKNEYVNERQARWQNILIELWIMTSATYVKSRRFDDAFKAISEADQLTMGLNADVWNQVGLVILQEENAQFHHRALDAFKRALTIDPEHLQAHLSLASVYINLQEYELAEQLLERATKGLGWNRTEAWYMLSQVYQQQENMQDAKKSLLFALQLSETNPILSLHNLPHFT